MIDYSKMMNKLAAAGLNSYRLRMMEPVLIAQSTLTRIKAGVGGIDHNTLNRLCEYFNCQPGDLMEWVPDEKEGAQTDELATKD